MRIKRALICMALLLAAAVGYGQETGGGGGRQVNKTVVIPAGGGAITNITWEDNTRYILATGTNTVQSGYAVNETPPIVIDKKTNIVIEGLGPQSCVFMAQTGTVFAIRDCYNIQFRDFRIQGTRGPNAHVYVGSVFAAVNVLGTNGNLTFDGMHIIDHADHGISPLLEIGGLNARNNTTNSTVRNCYFANIGTTNFTLAGLSRDGAALMFHGPDMTVVNNTFVNCLIAMEREGPVSLQGHMRRLTFMGNKVLAIPFAGFADLGAGAPSDEWAENIVIGNQFDFAKSTAYFGPGNGSGMGIKINAGRRNVVSGNSIRGALIGIVAQSGTSSIGDTLIEKNFVHGTVEDGISLGDDTSGGSLKGVVVRGNVVSHSGYRGIRLDGSHCIVDGNTLVRCSTNFAGLGAIIVAPNSTGSCVSNQVTRNTIFLDDSTSANSYAYGIEIIAGTANLLVEGNKIYGFSTAAWTDSGTGTRFKDNWVGTALLSGEFSGGTFYTNLVWSAGLMTPASQLTNFTADFAYTERSYLLTNNFHVSAVSNPGSDTAVRYLTVKLENLSGSTKIVSFASGIKRSGTNNVNVVNGSGALVQLQSFGSNITNTLGSITLFDSP